MIKTANLTGPVSRNAGGLYESVRRLTQSIEALDWQVCVFGTRDQHTEADIAAWAPVKVQAFTPLWPEQFGYSPEFLSALEEFKPAITHTHGIWLYSSMATNFYFRKHGTPYLISAHGMLDPWAIRNSRWKKVFAYLFYESSHLAEAACLRALCESEAVAIRQTGLKNPVATIPNGIDLPSDTEKRQAENTAAPWADFYPRGSGKKVLLFLSRIHPKKGLLNLLRAWAQIRQAESTRRTADEWVLCIAGWDQGGHETQLKLLATELNIPWADTRDGKGKPQTPLGSHRPGCVSESPSLLFLGPQFNEAKAACYAQCDAFVLPSFSEGVPMVVLEAWAYHKPVVMTPECNLPQGFSRSAAIRIETSSESIAQGLAELIQLSPADLRALADNGIQLVREQFEWPVIGADMVRLYDWILGGGCKPDFVG